MTKYKRSRLEHQSHAEDRAAMVSRAVSCDLGSSLPSSPTRSISDPLLRERPLEGAEASVTEFPEGDYNKETVPDLPPPEAGRPSRADPCDAGLRLGLLFQPDGPERSAACGALRIPESGG